MLKGEELQNRLIDFAVEIVGFCARLPRSIAGRHISDQLVRSGTAAAPHYAEARSAESSRDFLHKLRIALKELNESQVWLEIIERSQVIPADEFDGLRTECDELCRILGASVRTVKAKL
jgi:four helix bundle protein